MAEESKRCGYVFVYGTLKLGQHNFPIIEDYVISCEQAVLHGATMYDLGPYPGIVFNGKGKVEGELMLVENLPEVIKILDRLEGYRPKNLRYCHYMRRTADVELSNPLFNKRIKAYVYEIVDRFDYAHTKPVVENWVRNEFWTHN